MIYTILKTSNSDGERVIYILSKRKYTIVRIENITKSITKYNLYITPKKLLTAV